MTLDELKEELKRLNKSYDISYLLGYVRGLYEAKGLNDDEYCSIHLWICNILY